MSLYGCAKQGLYRPLQPGWSQPHLALLGLPVAHFSLQYILPSGTVQLQAGCAHLLLMMSLLLCHYNATLRNRSALPMTDTELKVIAALAMIGLSSRPKKGYSTPAAMGTPSML